MKSEHCYQTASFADAAPRACCSYCSHDSRSAKLLEDQPLGMCTVLSVRRSISNTDTHRGESRACGVDDPHTTYSYCLTVAAHAEASWRLHGLRHDASEAEFRPLQHGRRCNVIYVDWPRGRMAFASNAAPLLKHQRHNECLSIIPLRCGEHSDTHPVWRRDSGRRCQCRQ